ncbi:hypothetical protein KOR42_23570 [Thalassoglobus neptunius]|uniref:Uncharacterized protein n=1 Tax=Thalassoglobus neptunius TaxID=1938619 RepID=A0A5C5X7N7_9PLAN|nr:hypothetical protein [Thalassoglobus neptunius]TWT58970.1 hypothetical protein KOR42_23570 [Thalassoglobus neptunius]
MTPEQKQKIDAYLTGNHLESFTLSCFVGMVETGEIPITVFEEYSQSLAQKIRGVAIALDVPLELFQIEKNL